MRTDVQPLDFQINPVPGNDDFRFQLLQKKRVDYFLIMAHRWHSDDVKAGRKFRPNKPRRNRREDRPASDRYGKLVSNIQVFESEGNETI
jgi:hypothetical protein